MTWLVWNFDLDMDDKNMTYPLNRMTRFHHIRKLDLRQRNDQYFLHCSCGFFNRVGIPCPHFFFVFPHMEIEMFHIRNWKVFDAFYACESDLGKYLHQAQDQYFLNENHGIPVPERIMEISDVLDEKWDDVRFPKPCEGTTKCDIDDAMFVRRLPCCTHDDLRNKRFVFYCSIFRLCVHDFNM